MTLIAVETLCPVCGKQPEVLRCDGCDAEASVVLCPHRASYLPIRAVAMFSEYTAEMRCYECEPGDEDDNDERTPEFGVGRP